MIDAQILVAPDDRGVDEPMRWIKTIVGRTAADHLDWYGDETPDD
jgi:hypothetical protein